MAKKITIDEAMADLRQHQERRFQEIEQKFEASLADAKLDLLIARKMLEQVGARI